MLKDSIESEGNAVSTALVVGEIKINVPKTDAPGSSVVVSLPALMISLQGYKMPASLDKQDELTDLPVPLWGKDPYQEYRSHFPSTPSPRKASATMRGSS